MRMSSRRTVLITGLLIGAPFAAPAQQSCNPPAQPKLDWMGTQTGCRPSPPSNPSVAAIGQPVPNPCAVGEVINFKALPVAGSFQSCDGFAWNFGDPANGSASVQNPPYAFSSPGTFTVSVGVFNSKGATSASGLIALTLQPLIDEFIATPPKVILGQPVVLSWTTRYTTGVRIDPGGFTSALSSGSYTDYPLKTPTTHYTLTANGDAAQTAKSIDVDVTPGRHRSVRH